MTAVAHVFRWDLDKTYLRTEFDSLGDLLRALLENARQKRAVPGAPTLLRALRAAGGPAHRIAIVSGSPRQMRTVLQAKLALDGVEFDEFTLKPNLENLVRGRFRAVRAQVPYKLPALLESRLALADAPPETCFGDDAECDAIIYSLYADILSGRVGLDELEAVLEAAGAYGDEEERTLELAARLAERPRPPSGAVRRILIHLDGRSPTAGFRPYGARLVPIFNYFQGALVLYADGHLTAGDVIAVALEMMASGEYRLSSLANSLQDLLRRGHLAPAAATRLRLECQRAAVSPDLVTTVLPPSEEIAWAFATRVLALGDSPVRPAPAGETDLDYPALVRNERRRREHRRG